MANIVTVWSTFFITDAGLRLRQQSIATGETLKFCGAKIGQGVPSNPLNIPNMTDIVSVAEEVPVVRSISEGVTHFIGVRIDNTSFKQPILMTEIGIFATIGEDEPVLYGYTYATQGYDSIPAGNVSHYVWTIGIDTVISRAHNISFVYDGSKVYATEEKIDELIQAFDKFKDSADVKSAVDKSDQALDIVNKVKHQLENLSVPGIIRQDIVIPITGWVQGDPEEYDGLSVDIPIEDVAGDMIPIVIVPPKQIKVIGERKFSPCVKSDDGYIRLYSKASPPEPINATLILLITSEGVTGGGNYQLPTASEDRLGGVKIGENITVSDDGTISVNKESLIGDLTATNEETQAIIDKHFAINSNPAVKI